MSDFSLGYVTVATAGTPVNLSTVLSSLGLDTETRVHAIYFEPLIANTGVTYVGKIGLNKASGANVLKQINKQPASGLVDAACIKCPGANSLRLADYAVDADTSGDKLLITYSVV